MNSYKSSAELKSMAREILLGKYSVVVGAMLIVSAISLSISMTISAVVNLESTWGNVFYYIITLIVSLLLSVLSVGQTYLYLNICREREYKVLDIIYCFGHHPDKVIILSFIIFGITAVCLVPGAVAFIVYIFKENSLLLLLGTFLSIVGIVLAVIIDLRYSLIFYLLLDEPELSYMETLRKSKDLMAGSKGRMFYLQISFIGWQLLSLLSCNLASLWIAPYAGVTQAHFYLDLIGEKREVLNLPMDRVEDRQIYE